MGAAATNSAMAVATRQSVALEEQLRMVELSLRAAGEDCRRALVALQAADASTPAPTAVWAIQRVHEEYVFLAAILSAGRATLRQVEETRRRRSEQDRRWSQALLDAGSGQL